MRPGTGPAPLVPKHLSFGKSRARRRPHRPSAGAAPGSGAAPARPPAAPVGAGPGAARSLRALSCLRRPRSRPASPREPPSDRTNGFPRFAGPAPPRRRGGGAAPAPDLSLSLCLCMSLSPSRHGRSPPNPPRTGPQEGRRRRDLPAPRPRLRLHGGAAPPRPSSTADAALAPAGEGWESAVRRAAVPGGGAGPAREQAPRTRSAPAPAEVLQNPLLVCGEPPPAASPGKVRQAPVHTQGLRKEQDGLPGLKGRKLNREGKMLLAVIKNKQKSLP